MSINLYTVNALYTEIECISAVYYEGSNGPYSDSFDGYNYLYPSTVSNGYTATQQEYAVDSVRSACSIVGNKILTPTSIGNGNILNTYRINHNPLNDYDNIYVVYCYSDIYYDPDYYTSTWYKEPVFYVYKKDNYYTTTDDLTTYLGWLGITFDPKKDAVMLCYSSLDRNTISSDQTYIPNINDISYTDSSYLRSCIFTDLSSLSSNVNGMSEDLYANPEDIKYVLKN